MKRSIFVALTLSGVLCLTGCPEEQGPMESAGEAIDDAAEGAKESIEDAAEEPGPMEKAGEAIDDAATDAKESIEEATESK